MATLTQQTPTSHLCPPCSSLLEQHIQCVHEDGAHKLKSLEKSAKDGCPMCKWLWNSIPWLAQLELPPAAPALDTVNDISFCRRRAILPRPPRAGWFELGDWIYGAQPGILRKRAEQTIPGAQSPVPFPGYQAILAPSETNILSNSYIPSANTGASETLHLARHWMHKCISSHVACAAYRRPDWAPTRLLKILETDDGRISAQLQERDEGDYSSTVKYLALSHRWLGENESPLLSKENSSQFRDKIEISSLKASIRDAMFTTIRLGFHYLWVDTLCILQHNEDDKKHEIGKMDSVYSNALCTIAAQVGKTTDEGCFSSRNVDEVRTHEVYFNLGGNQSQHCLLRLSWDDINQELDNGSLARRGWAFQERFLSPRTLHFCAKQLHWECREFKANETHPEGNPIQSNRHSDMRFASMATSWSRIVESYTSRSLTFSTDRLRAIQGVADFLQRNSTANGQPDNYIHGIWQSSLPKSLIWRPKHQLRHDKLLKVAPTWSWASISEEVDYLSSQWETASDMKLTPLIEITEILSGSDIRSTDADRIFETKDDIIKIRGRFARFSMDSVSSCNPQDFYDYKGETRHDSEDRHLPIFTSSGFSALRGYTAKSFEGIIVRAIGGGKVYEKVGTYVQVCRVSGEDVSFGEEEDIYLC